MSYLAMKQNENPGLLITFCGLDGSGKTTMMKMLLDDIKKEKMVYVTKQPTNKVRESTIFRTYMDTPNHEAFDYRSLSLLAASDRLQHIKHEIEPALRLGHPVFSDRYFYSCLANLHARGYDSDQWIYDIAQHIIKPDVSFFFDIPVEIAIERVRSRENEKNRYIDIDLQYKLREEYQKICAANNGILISTEQPIAKCYEIVKKEFERVKK